MKILISAFACEPGRGSEPSAGWGWISGIAKFHQVHLITTELGKETIEATAHNVTVHYLPIKKLLPGTLGWLAYYLWQWRAGGLAVRLHKLERFDLCHALNYFSWRVPSFLWRLNIPFFWGPLGGAQNPPKGFAGVLGIRGLIETTWRNGCQRISRFDPFVRLTMRKATGILCANTPTLKLIPRQFRKKAELLSELAVHLPAQIRTRKPHTGPQRVLWAGRILPWKGLALFLRALTDVQKSVKLDVIVMGEGRDKPRCERLARKLGLRVRFTGWLTNAERDREFELADAFVFTSLHDTSGTVVAEAMAAGLPVILLDCSCICELLDGTCVAVPSRSLRQAEKGLAAAIERLANDPLGRIAIGAMARAHATREFSWERRIESALKLYSIHAAQWPFAHTGNDPATSVPPSRL